MFPQFSSVYIFYVPAILLHGTIGGIVLNVS